MDSVIAIPARSKKRENNCGLFAGKFFELTNQVLRVDISSLAAKAVGQSP